MVSVVSRPSSPADINAYAPPQISDTAGIKLESCPRLMTYDCAMFDYAKTSHPLVSSAVGHALESCLVELFNLSEQIRQFVKLECMSKPSPQRCLLDRFKTETAQDLRVIARRVVEICGTLNGGSEVCTMDEVQHGDQSPVLTQAEMLTALFFSLIDLSSLLQESIYAAEVDQDVVSARLCRDILSHLNGNAWQLSRLVQ